jgi:hypothetical protein
MNRFAAAAAGGAIVGFTTGYVSVGVLFQNLERTLEARLTDTERNSSGGASSAGTGSSGGSTATPAAPLASAMAWDTLSHAVAIDLCERIASEDSLGGAAPSITVLYNDGHLREFVQLMLGRLWKSAHVHVADPSSSDWALSTVLGVMMIGVRKDEATLSEGPAAPAQAASVMSRSLLPSVRELLQRKLLQSPGVAEMVLEVALGRANSTRLRRRERPLLFVVDEGDGNASEEEETVVGTKSAAKGGLHGSLQAFLARLPNAVRSLTLGGSSVCRDISSQEMNTSQLSLVC